MTEIVKKELIIDKKEIATLLTQMASEMVVIAPVKKKDIILFKPIKSGEEATIEFTNTHLSAKNVLFPQCEKMMTFTTDLEAEDAYIMKELNPIKQRQVIFGIRPCDAKSFTILDKVFAQGGTGYEDPYFLQRREKTIVIGLGCNRPISTCFCNSFKNSGPFATDGLDVLLTDIGNQYVVMVLTDKGKTLLEDRRNLTEADSASIEKAHQIKDDITQKVNSRIRMEKVKDKNVKDLFNDSLWDSLFETCTGCGICTYSCPTCHCFDIQDELTDTEGVRMRNWDSCMFPIYTLQASGHNPRPTKKERFRQRFMHKFKYFQDRYNVISCVGCGRCIRLCPVNIDIRQVLKEMNK